VWCSVLQLFWQRTVTVLHSVRFLSFVFSLVVKPQLIVYNISTWRAILESRWYSEKYTNDSFLGKRQRGEGPRISILMDINNLWIRSLFDKLSLGITEEKEKKTQQESKGHTLLIFFLRSKSTRNQISRRLFLVGRRKRVHDMTRLQILGSFPRLV